MATLRTSTTICRAWLLPTARAFSNRPQPSSHWYDTLVLATKGIPEVSVVLPETNGQEISSQESTKRVAVLVGWAASRTKSLAKYSDIYTSRGIPVVCVGTSIFDIFSTRLGLVRAETVLSSVCSVTDRQSILLHIFSGGGTVLWPWLVKDSTRHAFFSSLQCNRRTKQWAGFVFDSGPCDFTTSSGLAAARTNYEAGRHNLLQYSSSVAAGLTVDMVIGHQKRVEIRSALKSVALDAPQLYLYSKSDPVCPAPWIEKVAEKQAGLGRSVTQHSWQDTPHVSHFRVDPEGYTQAVHKFLDGLPYP